LLEDEEDMDDDIYTSDTLNGAQEASPADGVSSPPPSAIENGNAAVETLRDKGLKPAPLNTSDIGSVDGQRSPSSIASPLEKLRKAVEEEEGEGNVVTLDQNVMLLNLESLSSWWLTPRIFSFHRTLI
jgi:hypothetical protein